MRSFEEQKRINIGWAIDSLVTLDFHSRGTIRNIYSCMAEKCGMPLTMNAAVQLYDAVQRSERKIVFIGTGFLITQTLLLNLSYMSVFVSSENPAGSRKPASSIPMI